jgi:hypothetical protein
MWIMVEPIAEIPFGIHRSPTRCYGCNKDPFLRWVAVNRSTAHNLKACWRFISEQELAMEVVHTFEGIDPGTMSRLTLDCCDSVRLFHQRLL